MGHFFGTAYFWVKGKRGKLTRTNDVMIVGTDEFAVTHGAIPNAGLPAGTTLLAEGKA
jgi:hypothetical protein